MVYIGPDGNVVDRRSPWRLSIIKDILNGFIDVVLIFFRSVTAHPSRLSDHQRTTYAQRQNNQPSANNRGSNIRGIGRVKGSATAAMGGG
mmetsp:Transcript_452/g.697  ORF Transcript_452/g.697 Transcript_452/m.697 type:complete len:90 (+) Transcript_452:95-364(+)